MKVNCTRLVIEPVIERRALLQPQRWRLERDFEISIGEGEHRHHLRVPAGFVTDFASIPRWLKPLFPDSVNYGRAALVHDQLYARGEVGKVVADAILKGLIEDLDEAGPVVAEIVFLGVHLFGWFAWRGHREKGVRLMKHVRFAFATVALSALLIGCQPAPRTVERPLRAPDGRYTGRYETGTIETRRGPDGAPVVVTNWPAWRWEDQP